MKISVKVKAHAKQNKVEKLDAQHYQVWVKAPPHEGKANEAVVEVLSDYFGRPKSKFAILAGHQSKNKLISVTE